MLQEANSNYKTIPPTELIITEEGRIYHLDLKPDEIGQTIDLMKKILPKYNYIKEAILVDKPNETAIAVLFDNYINRHSSFDAIFNIKTKIVLVKYF